MFVACTSRKWQALIPCRQTLLAQRATHGELLLGTDDRQLDVANRLWPASLRAQHQHTAIPRHRQREPPVCPMPAQTTPTAT